MGEIYVESIIINSREDMEMVVFMQYFKNFIEFKKYSFYNILYNYKVEFV